MKSFKSKESESSHCTGWKWSQRWHISRLIYLVQNSVSGIKSLLNLGSFKQGSMFCEFYKHAHIHSHVQVRM